MNSNVNIIKASINSQKNWERIENIMIEKLVCKKQIKFITFCEMYFYKNGGPIETNWVGIIHDPPKTLKYYSNKNLLKHENFVKSLPYCKGLFCMSHELKTWVKKILKPSFFVSVLFHPVPNKTLDEFNFEEFKKNRQIIQIGNWLRKPYSIFKLNTHLNKTIIPFEKRMERELNNFVKRDKIKISKEEDSSVKKCAKITDTYYNELFKNSIVYLDLYASTCNNVILECIKTNCPIVINRLPPVEAYLGKEYPLFFENVHDINKDFINDAKIITAHKYLQNLDKSRFTVDYFISYINKQLSKLNE